MHNLWALGIYFQSIFNFIDDIWFFQIVNLYSSTKNI